MSKGSARSYLSCSRTESQPAVVKNYSTGYGTWDATEAEKFSAAPEHGQLCVESNLALNATSVEGVERCAVRITSPW